MTAWLGLAVALIVGCEATTIIVAPTSAPSPAVSAQTTAAQPTSLASPAPTTILTTSTAPPVAPIGTDDDGVVDARELAEINAGLARGNSSFGTVDGTYAESLGGPACRTLASFCGTQAEFDALQRSLAERASAKVDPSAAADLHRLTMVCRP